VYILREESEIYEFSEKRIYRRTGKAFINAFMTGSAATRHISRHDE
jgi:hypothetical protein